MNLTHESQRIARTRHPRVEVVAAPGSGKTTTLVARCAHIAAEGIDPSQIVLLSFSKHAVAHLRGRLSSIKGGDQIRVDTCHAFALDIVTQNFNLAGVKKAPIVLEATGAHKMICQTIDELAKVMIAQTTSEKASEQKRLKSETSWLLAQRETSSLRLFAHLFASAVDSRMPLTELLQEQPYRALGDHEATVAALRNAYRKAKRDASKFEFGDLLVLATKALQADDDVKGLEFEHLLIDEYQDSTPAQGRMFVALAERIRNIMVVGDPRQAIFGFGGARYVPLASLMDDVKKMSLSRSHRLPQSHAKLASAIAAATGKGIVVGHAGGAKPVLVVAESEAGMAWQVSSRIQSLLKSGVSAKDIVVLARLTDLLKPIQRALIAESVSSSGAKLPLGLDHVRLVLKLVVYVESTNMPEISDAGIAESLALDIAPRAAAAVERTCRVAKRSNSFEGRFDLCSKAYMQAVGGVRNDLDLRTALREWSTRSRGANNAERLLATIEALNDQQAVETSTIHAAKGREWKHVFVVGITDGVMPDHRADTPAKLVDERNVMYVAASRASETLTLVQSPCVITMRKRAITKCALSRFLKKAKKLDLI